MTSRLGADRFRFAGTAEFNGLFDAVLTLVKAVLVIAIIAGVAGLKVSMG